MLQSNIGKWKQAATPYPTVPAFKREIITSSSLKSLLLANIKAKQGVLMCKIMTGAVEFPWC